MLVCRENIAVRKETHMLRIGAVSRLTIDLLFTGLTHLPDRGEEVRADSFHIGLGGGSLVTPVLLGRMGMPVKLGTFLDDSQESAYARDLLSKQGCRTYVNFYRGSWRPVTVSVVMPLNGDRSIISYEEAPQTLMEEELLNFFADCGVALIPMLPSLAKRIRERGCAVALDTTDFDAPLSKTCLPLLEIITPNLREAAAITGEKLPADALRAFFPAGVKHPLIKLGAEGCMLLENGAPCIVPSVQGMRSVDTTGAGDNFLAGLMYGYARGWSFSDCVRMANVFGGLSTTAVGVFGASITQQSAVACYQANYGPLSEVKTEPCAI